MPNSDVRFQWHHGFEVGHPAIDDDHKALLDCLNRIAKYFAISRGEDAYEECLNFRAEIERHFEKENRFLRVIQFPRWQRHLTSHSKFTDHLLTYCAFCGERCRKSQEEECLTDLYAMLVEHFIKGDLDFKSYLEHENLANKQRRNGPSGSNT